MGETPTAQGRVVDGVPGHGARITVLGIFVADLAFRTRRLSAWGETTIAAGYRLSPGGKGSNQAVAAARLGAAVSFVAKIGRDPFGEMARATWAADGIDARYCCEASDESTGAAAIAVHPVTGENAIVAAPSASSLLTPEEVDRAAGLIAASAVFVTQLELPLPVVEHALALARDRGVVTILNAAPARRLPRRVYALCDYVTPNEVEAAALAGRPVRGPADAARAAEILLARGARNVVITLGKRGAVVRNAALTQHLPALHAGPVVETTAPATPSRAPSPWRWPRARTCWRPPGSPAPPPPSP